MLIVANWKAYVEDLDKAKKLFTAGKRITNASRVKVVLAPPAPYLGLFASKNRSAVAFAGQDLSATLGGAQTGEVTAAALSAAGAKYVIVGHSERRAAGESDELIAKKLEHAIAHDLIPILCIGEHERDSEGRYLSVIRGQIEAALKELSPKERAGIIVAYEPLWAIGKTAADAINSTDLAEMVLYIRKVLAELLPGKAGRALILYGGSVEADNVRALAAGSSVDGFLVGHASVDPKTFLALAKALS